jgi:ribose transport system substrate-binding protein
MDREKGFREVRDAEFPEVEIAAAQFSMGDQAKARDITENILAAHKDLGGIFCSTEPAAAGVMLALETRGLAGKIKVVSVDSSDNLVDLMKQDKIHALVAQDPFGMAYKAVASLVSKLDGKTPARRVDLEPRVISKADLDNPEVMRLLKPDIAKYR